MLFFDLFKIQLDAYLECTPATADLETELFPIHSIFYRFFIKGGAALKIFVDNLEALGIIGEKGTFIPPVANAPTDIDSNLVLNPAFSEAPTFILILKEAMRQECLKIMANYSSAYWFMNQDLIKNLQENAAFLKDMAALFHTEIERLFISEPSHDEMRGHNTIKPENSCVRLSVLNPAFASICVYRVLMCVDIYDVQLQIIEDEAATVGRRVSNALIHAEAELIDITIYEMNNPKINDMWEWAKQAMPFDARYTLFQGIHQMILDIIQMNTSAGLSRHPSLLSKFEKRQQRLNYLYYLYCNYLLIQNIVENKNKIKEQHITNYCHKLVQSEFLRLGLTPVQMNEILPYVIGKGGVPFEQIINDFIQNHLVQDNSIDHEISMQSGRVVSSKHTPPINASLFPSRALQKIKDYVIGVIPPLSSLNKALVLVELVALLKESRTDGSVNFVLLSALLDACGAPVLQFIPTARTIYKNMIKMLKLVHKLIFSSNEYHQIIQNRHTATFQRYVFVVLNENIGRLCKTLLQNIEIAVDIVLLNKFTPFRLVCIPKIKINFIEVLEQLFLLVHEFMNRLGVPFIITYELHPEFILNVAFRLPFNKTIKSINLKSFAEIHFCKFFIKYQPVPQHTYLIYNNSNKSFYQMQ